MIAELTLRPAWNRSLAACTVRGSMTAPIWPPARRRRPWARRTVPFVHLVQSLDEYVVGYQESRGVIDLVGAEAAHRDTPGLPSALVLVDGQIAGRWRRRIRAADVDVEVVAYRPFETAEASARQAEADRHAAALGRSATLTTSPV